MPGKFTAPAPTPKDPQALYQQRKQDFEAAWAEFQTKVFQNKVLAENKSVAAIKTENDIVDKLVKACVDLDNSNAGEGILAMLVMSLREELLLRDRINELEYTLLKLKKDLGVKNEPKKS